MYAVFISSTTNTLNTMRQVIIASHDGKEYAWQRLTNGGRGESNAWVDTTYAEVINSNWENSFVIGEVIATPLTIVDTTSLDNHERPNVLIQKMSKQWATCDKEIQPTLVKDVISEVEQMISTDVSQLEKYRLDRRKGKGMTATKNYDEPIIKVTREVTPSNYERDVNALVIPTKNEIGFYIPRKFAGNVDEYDVYEHARLNKKPILLEGHAGTGKTSSAINYAYQKQIGVSVMSCSAGLQVSDLIGKTIIMPNGEAGWIDGELTRAMKFGGVFVLDEIDFAQPKVLQRAQDVATNFKLTLNENNGEVIYAHPDFVLVATYNNGYKHSNALNEAVLDRYKIKLYFDYDNNIESQIIKLPTLLKLANQMRNDAIQGIYTTPISLRMLKAFQELALDLHYDFAVDNFLMCFNADERPSVKLLLEAHADQLQSEVSNLSMKVGA